MPGSGSLSLPFKARLLALLSLSRGARRGILAAAVPTGCLITTSTAAAAPPATGCSSPDRTPVGGKLIQMAEDGTQTELVPGQLEQPTGMTIASNGDIYVSNHGGSATDGQVVPIRAASDDRGAKGHGAKKNGKKHRKHRH